MIKIIKIEEDINYRLDKYLRKIYTSLTQSFIEKNIRKKNIIVNNKKTYSNYLIKENDIIKILNFHPDKYKNKIIYKKNIVIPQKLKNQFKKSIKFENDNFIILNKWSSISSQGGSKINISIDDIIKNVSNEYRLVHRLDRDTSGLMIISKNLNSAKLFGTMFKSKEIDKSYLALCEGKPRLKESNVKLDIKNKLNKLNSTITYYKLLYNYNGISLILFKPITGKTHQLRIVAKNLGSPIIGDIKYNTQSKFKKETLKLNAHTLKFFYSGKEYKFISSLPYDFSQFAKKEQINIKI